MYRLNKCSTVVKFVAADLKRVKELVKKYLQIEGDVGIGGIAVDRNK